MKALVTGADGFIGSHLCELLVRNGFEVKATCLYNAFGNQGWLDDLALEVKDNIEIVAGDVRDPRFVDESVKGCQKVFHLAALIGIPYSYLAPHSYVETNITGTLNVLEACRNHNTERVLVTSTSEVYGTAKYVPIDESHPLQGQSPYSATKIGADRISESYFRSFDLPVTIVRPFNTYGPRQSSRAIIPTVIRQVIGNVGELLLGDLSPTRDLVFVEDTARGFLEIANSDSTLGEEINIATGNEISIGDLVQLIQDSIGTNIPIVTDEARLRPKNSEVERLLGSNSKLKNLTGWVPNTELSAGLEKTIKWFQESDKSSRSATEYIV